jgi:hypothetical protein
MKIFQNEMKKKKFKVKVNFNVVVIEYVRILKIKFSPKIMTSS